MRKVFKKAKRVKNVPLIALAFFATIFIGEKTFAAFQVVADEAWLYQPHATNPDPTDPNQYSPGNVSSQCQAPLGEICGIMAPDNGGEPEIDSSLEGEILAGKKTDRVFLKP